LQKATKALGFLAEPETFFSFSAMIFPSASLFRFFVSCVLPAELAELTHLKPVRIVLLVLHRVVVSLFTLCTSQCNLNSHVGTSVLRNKFGFSPASLEKSGIKK